MKNRVITILIIFCSMFLFSCKEKVPNNDPSKYSNLTYPAKVGNHWTYERIYTITLDTVLPGFDSILYSGYTETYLSTSYIDVESEKVLHDTLTAYEFVEYHHENEKVKVAYTYYTNEEEGFYMQAYQNTGVAFPSKKDYQIEFNGHRFNNLDEFSNFVSRFMINNVGVKTKTDTIYPTDSLIVESPPVESLSYPLYIGKEWIYKKGNNKFIEIHKKVLSTESVVTSAGTFSCYKIKLLYLNAPMEHEFYLYDYFCGVGLVKRFFFAEIWFSDGEGNIIASGSITEDLSLTDYFVQ